MGQGSRQAFAILNSVKPVGGMLQVEHAGSAWLIGRLHPAVESGSQFLLNGSVLQVGGSPFLVFVERLGELPHQKMSVEKTRRSVTPRLGSSGDGAR